MRTHQGGLSLPSEEVCIKTSARCFLQSRGQESSWFGTKKANTRSLVLKGSSSWLLSLALLNALYHRPAFTSYIPFCDDERFVILGCNSSIPFVIWIGIGYKTRSAEAAAQAEESIIA